MKTRIVIEFETIKMNKIDDGDDSDPTDITKQVEKALHDAVFKHVEDLTVQNDDFASDTIENYSDEFEISVNDYLDFSDYGEIVMRVYKEDASVSQDDEITESIKTTLNGEESEKNEE